MGFLKRLFGLDRPQSRDASESLQRSMIVQSSSEPSGDVMDRYYDSMGRIQAAMSRRDYVAAAAETRISLKLIPGWVKATRESYGSFDIASIPAIEQGAIALALTGDDQGLREMADTVAASPDLAAWADRVKHAFGDLNLFARIQMVVAEHPGCLQASLKTQLGQEDGSRIATLTSYLEKAGLVARVKSGRTYKLFPPGSADVPVPPPQREVGSHRIDKVPPHLREVDVTNLEYVPLPRSPLKWEEAQAGRERAKSSDADGPFEVRDADWTITSVEKIPASERPDSAYRISHPCQTGVILIDDLGKAEGLGAIPASAMRYDRSGNVAAKAALLHDTYRLGVHPLGDGLIALSRDADLHAYDHELKPILETAVSSAPEISEIRKRFEISEGELKNHLRCVALSRDSSRYLFTVVDEAWCVSLDGKGLWGARLPIQDGWTAVAAPAGQFGTSDEIQRALRLMELALPVTPEEIKTRYRALAKKWHPDFNPDDVGATEKMQALSAAAAVLTGIEASLLPKFTGTVFKRELDRHAFEADGLTFTVTMGLQAGEKFAADWIYAASFAASSHGAYLAGYSGRVVEVDERGEGVRVYDIGAVPRQIIDTGRHLYLLTDTRLYVLRGNALCALVDTFDGGDLLVAENGFGLLEKKRMRWFSPAGDYIGSVATRDPIRRVYFSHGRLIVETRQGRAEISGAPNWWSS